MMSMVMQLQVDKRRLTEELAAMTAERDVLQVELDRMLQKLMTAEQNSVAWKRGDNAGHPNKEDGQ